MEEEVSLQPARKKLQMCIKDSTTQTSNQKLKLSTLGLPCSILKQYADKGITSLFEWQIDCLDNVNVMKGQRNLLYSAPTSAGKTLVSEIIMIKRVLEHKTKAIMVLPFVSVATEKVNSLKNILIDTEVRVGGFIGEVNAPGGFDAVDIAICTIEKANSLINKIIAENKMTKLGTLVVDELHLISDPRRGYLLELILTKVLYAASSSNSGITQEPNRIDASKFWNRNIGKIQVIGMSATLPNLNILADWMNAESFVTNFRPVPLMERIVIDKKIYNNNMEYMRDVNITSIPIKLLHNDERDSIIYLALETVLNGYSVIIFCPTKHMVEIIASDTASDIYKIGKPDANQLINPEKISKQLRAQLDSVKIKTVMNDLGNCSDGVDENLHKTVRFGVGFHHAGLTYENRNIVESAFKNGTLKVLVATSTLSAGVNLPARRVIVANPNVDITTYRQMCGRAGRNGLDTEGESILVCNETFKEKGVCLFKGCLPPLKSSLLKEDFLNLAIRRVMMEAFAAGLLSRSIDVHLYAKFTFLFYSMDLGLYTTEELSPSHLARKKTVEDSIKYLVDSGLIRKSLPQATPLHHKYISYERTQLGTACLAASLTPDDGIQLYKDLMNYQAKGNFQVELLTVYQVTPVYISETLKNLDWNAYYNMWQHLGQNEKDIGTLLGVNEAFIFRSMIGATSPQNKQQNHIITIHKRFYAALALSEWINEEPIAFIATKFGFSMGAMQVFLQASTTFAGLVVIFSDKLELSKVSSVIDYYRQRVEFGVRYELCNLMRLKSVNREKARILYNVGVKSILALSLTDPAKVNEIFKDHAITQSRNNVVGTDDRTLKTMQTKVTSDESITMVQDAFSFINSS